MLTNLQDYALEIKPNELEFARPEIQYLGHVITKEVIKPNIEKIRLMLEMKPCRNIKEVQTLLDLTSYY